MNTIDEAIEKFGFLSEPLLTEAVEEMLEDARESQIVQIPFIDWPEAHIAALRYPNLLSLGEPVGPDHSPIRVLEYLGEIE